VVDVDVDVFSRALSYSNLIELIKLPNRTPSFTLCSPHSLNLSNDITEHKSSSGLRYNNFSLLERMQIPKHPISASSTFAHSKMSSMHLSQLRKWMLESPPVEWAINQLREQLIGALRQGPIPQHVAFVMDGNRRFARSHKIETVEGHNLGFEALARVCMPMSSIGYS
jgi:hypothetical protein